MKKYITIICSLTFCVQLFSQNYFELPVRYSEYSGQQRFECNQNNCGVKCKSHVASGENAQNCVSDGFSYKDYYNDYNVFETQTCDGFCGLHTGVDLYAPEGTPVLASGDGRVAFINSSWANSALENQSNNVNGTLGYFVILKHEVSINGTLHEIYSKYCHLEDVNSSLSMNEVVAKGQQIGTVGDTGNGNAGKVHLHLEFSSNLNPCGSGSLSCGYVVNPTASGYLDPYMFIKNSITDGQNMEYDAIGCDFPMPLNVSNDIREFEPNNVMNIDGSSKSLRDANAINLVPEMRIQNIPLAPITLGSGSYEYARMYANFNTPYDKDIFSFQGTNPGTYIVYINNLSTAVSIDIFEKDSNSINLLNSPGSFINAPSSEIYTYCKPGKTYFIEITGYNAGIKCAPYNIYILQNPAGTCSTSTNVTSPFTWNNNDQERLDKKDIPKNLKNNNPEIEIVHNQLCFANSYNVNVDIVSTSSYSIVADIYENGNLINSVSNLNENSNYPIGVASNISLMSNINIVYTGHSDNQCSIDVQENIYGGSCPATPVCEIPSNLTATTSGGSTSFSWANISAANNYTIQYSSDGFNNNLGGGIINSNSISSSFASCNTYYFRVRSNCSTGSSAYSEFMPFYVGNGSNASCPIPFLAIQNNGNYIQANWNNVSGETGYEIQYRQVNGSWMSKYLLQNDNSHPIQALNCADYEVRIRTICNCVSSNWSTIQSISTTGCNVTTPSCNDGMQNGTETGVDCGGSCPNCPSNTCNDFYISNPSPTNCNNQFALVSSVKDILWVSGNCTSGLVNILYSINGGNSWNTVVNNSPDDGFYQMTFTTAHVSNQFRIRIECTSGSVCAETCNYTIGGDNIAGCTDPNSHNYSPSATYDNGTCETCYDGIINGDETGIDCGGSNPLCNPCNPGNNVILDNNTCGGTYSWDQDFVITWDPGSNSCSRVFFDVSDDGGLNWQRIFNPSQGISNDGAATFNGSATFPQTTGQILFRITCTNNSNNYSISSCPTLVTTCGGSLAINDSPCGAIFVPTSNQSCNYQTYSTCNALASGVPDPPCGSYDFGDLWYEVLVPPSGVITVQINSPQVNWPKVVLYGGNCGNVSLIQCLDSAPNNNQYFEQTFENLSPGNALFLRFFSANFGVNSIGNFDMCVYEPQVCSGENLNIPPDFTVSCYLDASDLSITGDVLGETVICPSCNEATYSDSNNYTICGGGNIIRRWEFNDECNATYFYNQIITILPDNSPPDFDEPQDVVLPCDTDIYDYNTIGLYSNFSNLCGQGTGGFYDNVDGLDYCSNTGLIIRFWYYEDDCGNRTTKVQNIYLYDNGCEATRCEGENCNTAEQLTVNGYYFCDGPSFGNSATFSSDPDVNHADWFYFTAPEDGVMTIYSCYQYVDTRFTLHEGSCGSLNFISTFDDECEMSTGSYSYASSGQINVSCGSTYYIEWDDKWSQTDFNFYFHFNPNNPTLGCNTTLNVNSSFHSFESDFDDFIQTGCDDLDWIRHSGNTTSSGTGPSSAYDGNYYLYVESSGNGTGYPNKKAIIETPCYDLTGFNQPTFSYWIHRYGVNAGTLETQYSINDGPWITGPFHNNVLVDTWYGYGYDFTAHVGQTVKFRFIATTGNGYTSDIAIDKVHWYDDCPSNLLVNFDTGPNSDYNYERSVSITADSKVVSTSELTLDAGNHINLDPGFEVELGAYFHAYIDGCGNIPPYSQFQADRDNLDKVKLENGSIQKFKIGDLNKTND